MNMVQLSLCCATWKANLNPGMGLLHIKEVEIRNTRTIFVVEDVDRKVHIRQTNGRMMNGSQQG